MPSLDNLSLLLLASLDDVARVTALLNTAMQQADHPAFELSLDGVIWYLNAAAAAAIGVSPQQAVGARLTTYVSDSLMTQRRLDALGQSPQAQSWPDAWLRNRQPVPCRMTGFVVPSAISGERPRMILWSERAGARKRKGDTSRSGRRQDLFLAVDRHVCGRDLDPLGRRYNTKITRLCEQIGVSTITWYAWRRAADDPITSRTVELHLRLLDAMPDLLQVGAHPLDLQEALRSQRGIDLPLTDVAILLGVDPRNAYGWRHGQPASPQIQALTASLLLLVMQKPRTAWDDYVQLVERQGQLERVDLWNSKSWTPEVTPSGEGVGAQEPPPRRGGRRGRFEAMGGARPAESAARRPPEQAGRRAAPRRRSPGDRDPDDG